MGLSQTLVRMLVLLSSTVLIVLIMGSSTFDNEEKAAAPLTTDLANSVLLDWSIPLLILGMILAMAMIGASYLVRDERLSNLEQDAGWEMSEK